MRNLSRRELLEIRRAAHEQYLRRRLWPMRVWLEIEGGYAVLRRGDSFELRFPAVWLFETYAMSRLGV